VSPPRPSATAPEELPGELRSGDDRRWHLEDQRDFLVRSLADLALERDAGDIEARDYEALLTRDRGRLDAVEAELCALDAEDEDEAATSAQPAPSGGDALAADAPAGSGASVAKSRRRPFWLVLVAAVALSAGTTLLVVHLATPRLPGQPETGSITQSLAQEIQTQLAEASVLVDEGTKSSLTEALSLYGTVLTEDADQPQALAETGWLEWEAGDASGDTSREDQGQALVVRSLKIEPDDYAAHLFLGTIELEQGHDAAAAVMQYKAFLAEHPPKSLITPAATLIRQAFTAAGQPVPAAVSG
jgi:cytochrome c-type biogenesis protein CcmH/NrfG